MKISGRISNSGRFDAHIDSATFNWRSSPEGSVAGSKALSCDLSADHIQGIALPLHLPAQTGQEFAVTDLREVDLGLAVALHDRRLVTLTFRTASGKKAKARIKYAK